MKCVCYSRCPFLRPISPSADACSPGSEDTGGQEVLIIALITLVNSQDGYGIRTFIPAFLNAVIPNPSDSVFYLGTIFYLGSTGILQTSIFAA